MCPGRIKKEAYVMCLTISGSLACYNLGNLFEKQLAEIFDTLADQL